MTSINLSSYIEKLRSSAPTPGGGSASCMVAALGCAQAHMLCALALNHKDLPERAKVATFAEQLTHAEQHFYELAAADAKAYQNVDAALKLPRTTAAEKTARTEALQHALTLAAAAPLEALTYTQAASVIVRTMVSSHWTTSAISDVSVAASFLQAAAVGFQATIWANTHWMKDEELKKHYLEQSDLLVATIQTNQEEVTLRVREALS